MQLLYYARTPSIMYSIRIIVNLLIVHVSVSLAHCPSILTDKSQALQQISPPGKLFITCIHVHAGSSIVYSVHGIFSLD